MDLASASERRSAASKRGDARRIWLRSPRAWRPIAYMRRAVQVLPSALAACQTAEPGTGLDHGDEAGQVGVRREVPDAQRREARAADVQVAEGGKTHVEVGRPQEEGEARDQEDSPEDEEDEQREGAIDAEEGL